jgi:hypothetical protein
MFVPRRGKHYILTTNSHLAVLSLLASTSVAIIIVIVYRRTIAIIIDFFACCVIPATNQDVLVLRLRASWPARTVARPSGVDYPVWTL